MLEYLKADAPGGKPPTTPLWMADAEGFGGRPPFASAL